MFSRTVYQGPKRKLVLGFDVGTTYSGISYSILDPGRTPTIKGVTRYLARGQPVNVSKVPSIIYYDQKGEVRAVGADSLLEEIVDEAVDEKWIKAEWFKLHLRPTLNGRTIATQIPPLPVSKSAVQVFSGFLRYLFSCTETYIKETEVNGDDVWSSIKDDITFILSHPNGWEGPQQRMMREAAVDAGLLPRPESVSEDPSLRWKEGNQKGTRLMFVTEGEASLHFAIQNGLPGGVTRKGEGVTIVDAGGGTIDISSYRKSKKEKKEVFEEITCSQSQFEGSVFVTLNARSHLKNHLAESDFIEDLDDIIASFDGKTKIMFKTPEIPQYIRFGSIQDNDEAYGIRMGQLKLAGSDVASFFEPSVKCIVDAVLSERKVSHKPISHVVLVGGLSANDYLRDRVNALLTPYKLNVLRPDNYVNKAVSDGAISFYLDHFVRARVSKFTYGIFGSLRYNLKEKEHQKRYHQTYSDVGDVRRIPNVFATILPKNTKISEAREFRNTFTRSGETLEEVMSAGGQIWCYKGNGAKPRWLDVDTANYVECCSLEVDLSMVPPVTKTSASGKEYLMKRCDVIMLFGLTELEVYIEWKEEGLAKRYPVKLVYDASRSQTRLTPDDL